MDTITINNMADEVLCFRNNGAMEDILGQYLGEHITESEYCDLYSTIYNELKTYNSFSNGCALPESACDTITDNFMKEITITNGDDIKVRDWDSIKDDDIYRWNSIMEHLEKMT